MESGVRKALGKGIEALFPAPQERRVPAAAPNELAVPIHEIVPHPEQPRRHFDDEALGQHGLTQDELAERVGKSRPAITNTLRLLGLPDAVKAQLESGELTAGHARAVLAIEGVTEQVSFAREIVTRHLTKSETERLAAARRARQGKQPAAGRPTDLHLRGLAEEFTRGLGTRVRITRHPRGGSIAVEFYSDAG